MREKHKLRGYRGLCLSLVEARKWGEDLDYVYGDNYGTLHEIIFVIDEYSFTNIEIQKCRTEPT